MNMNKHFVNYHCHNSYSNISTPDCASTVLDYINRAKELNHKMLFCTQHGGTQGWTELYQECKKNNIKFGVGAEVYWVKDRFEKDKTNNHLIILAKNENGRRALNRIISEASKTGYYYKTRVDIDLIMSLPENDVVLTTACLGFYGYENYEEYIKMFHDKFKNNFFLEVQANNVDKQINLNKELLELSKKYNIKLIAGLDSHFIYPEEKEDRRLFLLSKGIEYELEHGWDMDYCDYDTLFNRFKNQNIFSDEQIIDFIEITNLFLDFEDIYLDFENIKLPTIYKDKTQEEKNYILKRILADEVKNKFGTIDIPIEYKKAINEEWKVIEDTNMADYFLLNYEIIKRGIELGGRITLTSRGCFTEDAIIQTSNSMKTIKDIEVGDKVLNKDGIFRKVIERFEYDIEEDMVEFQYQCQGSSYKKYKNICTNDHKILTKEGWKRADELTIGDLLCVPKIKELNKEIIYDLAKYVDFKFDDKYIYEVCGVGKEYRFSPKWLERNGIMNSTLAKEIINGHRNFKKSGVESVNKLLNNTPFKSLDDYSKYCKKHGTTTRKIKRFVKMDKLMNMFVGAMYADGWTHHNNAIGFAVNNTTKKWVNRRLFSSIANRFGLEPYENKSKNKNLCQLFINSITLNNFFKKEFFSSKKGVSKIVNEDLLKQSKDMIYWLKKGFDVCDGSVNYETNKLSYDSTSISLIGAYKIMNNILRNEPLSFDVRFGYTDKRGYNNSESYKIRRPIERKKQNIIEDSEYWYLPITDITNISRFKGKVYDLHIEKEHNYVINNIVVHNSAPSWIICNLLGFTTIDRVHSPIQLYPERFLTTDRILAGSVPDIDYNLGNREAFIQAQKDILGDDNSYFFASYGKLKEKSAWKMFAKANNIPYEISNEITKYIDDYEKAKKYADEEESIEIEKYIPKEYLEVFNGSKKYQGIIDSISCAPCGFLLSQDSISENIGLIRTREGICCNIDGLTADKALMLKNDLLSVTVVDIIYDTFEKIGITPITSTELINITKGDSKVWDIYKNGYTMCLNQVEQPKTREKVMKYKPLNISELSAFVASVRPAFQSMLNTFLNREDFRYGIDALDDILMTEELPQSLLLYQENLMSVLSYSGFPITETYSIMKSIAKKKTGIIEPIKDRFLDGFTKNSKADMSKTMMVWKIIEDSASYLFNASHSLSVALDSLYGAYLKAYYPLEFYTTVIEIYTEKKDLDKLTLIKSEMKEFGIKEQKAKFRNDSKISFNKENNTINASISSIKHISESCANGLYSLKDKQYSNFYELVKDIYDNKIANSRQLNILIMLNYFEEFGKIGKLLKIEELYQTYNGKKTFKKDNLTPDIYDLIKKYSEKETAKQFSIVNIDMVINEIISTIKDFDIPTKDKILAEFQYVGYATTTDNCGENICIVSNIDESKSNPILTLYYLATGVSKNIKIKSKVFKDSGLTLYNLMKVIEISLDRKWIMDGKDVNGKNKYKRGDEKEEILTLFEVLA